MNRATVPAIAVFVLILYGAGLAYTPIYLSDAEVLFALNAHSIATTAHDVNGRLLPLYFQVYQDMWFHPVLVYFSALFLTLLPLSETSIRLPSVAVGILDVVLTYLVARRLLGRPLWAVLAAALLALTPAHFIHSRLAMDFIYPLPFILAWLLCLLTYLERHDARVLFLAGSCLGLGIFSYIAALVMMPLYLAMTFLVLLGGRDRPVRLSLVALAGFVWPWLILVPWVVNHAEAFAATAGRYRLSAGDPLLNPISAAASAQVVGTPLMDILQNLRHPIHFSGLTGRISLYWYFFDPSYLFLTGSYANVVNSTRHVGVFLMPLLVFVLLGLASITRSPRSWPSAVVAFGFLTAPLAAVLVVPEPYAVDRELEILPFAALVATFGARYLLTAHQRRLRILAVCLLALVPVDFAFFAYDYFVKYRVESAVHFEGNRRGAIEYILARDAKERVPAVYLSTEIPYIDAYWRFYLIKARRLDLLRRTAYVDPKNLNAQAVPPGGLLMMSRKEAVKTLGSERELREAAAIPEPADPPSFLILERIVNGGTPDQLSTR